MHWSVIKYQPEMAKSFLGSPSIVRLPDDALLASHDYFGPGCPRNHEQEESLTSLYRSEDNGASWVNITHIMNCYWNTLFVHQGHVYIIGTSQQYGSIVIRRSEDGGYTWTQPKDAENGLLFKGGPYVEPPNYHCGPMPMLYRNGRIYRAFEDCDPPIWGSGFQAGVISAPVDADLLNAASWTISNKLPFDPQWVPADWGELPRPGWLEGNVVEAPDGSVVNVLRFNAVPLVNRAAIVKVSDDGSALSFDPADFIDFPGGGTKFTIRRDPRTGLYLSLVNPVTDPNYPSQRNILSLSVSRDLRHWELVKTLMTDESGLNYEDSMKLTGFQYVDWQFDGDDIIYMVRTAYRGAIRFHDANYMIYRVLKDYARYLPE